MTRQPENTEEHRKSASACAFGLAPQKAEEHRKAAGACAFDAGKPRVKLLLNGRRQLLRLPYPQTPTSAREWLEARGATVAELALANGLPRLALVDVLRGRTHGSRGQTHRAAIALGIKPDLTTLESVR